MGSYFRFPCTKPSVWHAVQCTGPAQRIAQALFALVISKKNTAFLNPPDKPAISGPPYPLRYPKYHLIETIS